MSLFKSTLILFALLSAAGCAQQTTTTQSNPAEVATTIAHDIDVNTFSGMMGSKPDHILLDVRSPEETAQAKLPGAMEIDFYQSDFLEKVDQLPKDKPVFVYCRSGNRSGQAMDKMKTLGFVEVYNLSGGITAWQAAGLPIQ
ncbi:MAG: rhodanese-like domain-containing protein [Saprospiraceae bacterium]|nr:rhodanese-like domain-containing protein [Saprospiraceae bacterium]